MATRNLKKGCTGSDVKSLQKKLKKLGYYSGGIDGSFGPVTDSAVRKFQKANGLKADGIVGLKTRAVLAGKTKKTKSTAVQKNRTKPGSKKKTTTHEIGKWNGHKFIVSSKLIRGFTGLQIKGSSKLKSAKDSGPGKVARESGNPTEISMTIKLNAFVGIDVRKEAMAFVGEARAGKKGYFYIGKKKLVSCKLMLTEATVKEVEINIGGKWTSADVSVTMKQCNKGGKADSSSSSKGSGRSGSSGGGSGGSGGGGGYSGSNKVSVRSSPAKISESGVDAVSGAAPTATKVKTATGAISRIAGNAKKVTTVTKTAGTTVKAASPYSSSYKAVQR